MRRRLQKNSLHYSMSTGGFSFISPLILLLMYSPICAIKDSSLEKSLQVQRRKCSLWFKECEWKLIELLVISLREKKLMTSSNLWDFRGTRRIFFSRDSEALNWSQSIHWVLIHSAFAQFLAVLLLFFFNLNERNFFLH